MRRRFRPSFGHRNGGTLTPAERARIDREENRTSRQIYRAKHDDGHM